MNVPFHDEQVLLPEARIRPSLKQQLIAAAFFSERDRVFTPAMEEDTLVQFYNKYGIAYPEPWYGGRRNINFWVMTYVAALISKAGPPPEIGQPHLCGDANRSATTIRAEIWLHRVQAVRLESHQSPISWSVKQGTYSINEKVFGIHPLLKVQKGQPYAHLLPAL